MLYSENQIINFDIIVMSGGVEEFKRMCNTYITYIPGTVKVGGLH